jgi:nitrogen fixation NifU-like protein
VSALYGEVVAAHFRRPHNQGPLASPDVSQEGLNPLCGDRVRIELRLRDGRIDEARFQGDACMVAVAAASLLTELLRGLSPDEARALPAERLLAELRTDLRPSRRACALLPLDTLREGLARWQGGAR